MMSVQGEADYLRRSMLAGAREFLVKPFSSDELAASIRQVHVRERAEARPHGRARGRPAAATGDDGAEPREAGKIVTLFSPKGGVGRTTLAVNFAVAAGREQGKSVALVDGGFQFGDVGVLLNLNPKNKSIADVVARWPAATSTTLESDARQPQHRHHACCWRRPARRWPSSSPSTTFRSIIERAARDARLRGRRLLAALPGRDPRPSSTSRT